MAVANDSMLSKPVVREAQLGDHLAVTQMLNDLGLKSSPTDAESSLALWQRYWVTNPAASIVGAEFPIGWVMENAGRIVGYCGNIPARYRLNGRNLIAGVATGWGVRREFREWTGDLVAPYFAQPQADLLIISSAISPAAKRCVQFGAAPLPHADYLTPYYWILNSRAFAEAILRPRIGSAALRTFATTPAAVLVKGVSRWQRQTFRSSGRLKIDSVSLSMVGDEFDDLWDTISRNDVCIASRRAEEIRWHYAPHEAAGNFTLLTCRRNSDLIGFLALTRDTAEGGLLTRSKIVDLFVNATDRDAVQELMTGAYELAAQESDLLELYGHPSGIRSVARDKRPLTRRFRSFPFYYKAGSLELDQLLARPYSWYPTFYDGDSSL